MYSFLYRLYSLSIKTIDILIQLIGDYFAKVFVNWPETCKMTEVNDGEERQE